MLFNIAAFQNYNEESRKTRAYPGFGFPDLVVSYRWGHRPQLTDYVTLK